MVSGNQSSFCVRERKIGDDENRDAAADQQLNSAGNVTDIPSALPAITTKSNTKWERSSTIDKEERMKLLDNGEEGEGGHVTPKSEKHKIPAMIFCPLPPLKPKSTPRKRKFAITPATLYIPSDFPQLDLLFGSDSKSASQHKKKKQKN